MPKIKTRKSVKKRIVGLTADQRLRVRKMSVRHRARFKSKRAKIASAHNLSATKVISKKLATLIQG